MPTAKQESALARIEVRETRHNPVVEADTPTERDGIVAERLASGAITPGTALLIVPHTCDDFAEWERRCHEGVYRKLYDQ
jgi:hypothetical protein